MKILKISLAISFIASLLLTACGDTTSTNIAPNANSVPPAATNAANTDNTTTAAATGAKLYADNCAFCHKEDGRGGEVTIEGKTIEPDDLTSNNIKNFTDDKIYGYISNGVPDEGMPAFKDKLSDQQIKEIIRYVRSDIQKVEQKPAASPVK